MSLNWKEINLVLTELNLSGSQIQRVVQSAYDVLALHLYREGKATTLLIALTPGACRLHATYRAVPKPEKPLRFAEFLKSRIVNGWITEAVQLGTDRIVRISIQRGDLHYRMYLRLWSNAANVIVTDETGTILDVMRRSPRRGEITGGRYVLEETAASRPQREFEIRTFEGPGTFNEQIDAYYAEHGGALSLEALREQVRKLYEGRLGRLAASLDRLREKEAAYKKGNTLKEYGDILMANLYQIHQGDAWFEGINFYADETVRIKLDPHKSPQANAEAYYEQYHKAKHGLKDVVEEIERGEAERDRLEAELAKHLHTASTTSAIRWICVGQGYLLCLHTGPKKLARATWYLTPITRGVAKMSSKPVPNGSIYTVRETGNCPSPRCMVQVTQENGYLMHLYENLSSIGSLSDGNRNHHPNYSQRPSQSLRGYLKYSTPVRYQSCN